MSSRLTHNAILLALVLIVVAGSVTSCSKRPGGWFTKAEVMSDFRLPQQPTKTLGQPTALAAFTSDELYGRISSDGYFLVYASNQKGNLDIWLRDLTTGMPERLTQHVAVDTQPAFSPDGETIAFVSMREDVKGDIYLRPFDKDKLTRLTDRTTEDAYPVFAPDGKSLIFASGPEGNTRIVRMWLKDKRIEALTDYGATQPAISADGRFLAWVQRGDDRINRVMLRDQQTNTVRIVETRGYQSGFPAFSPDGQWLYFTRFYYTQPNQSLSGDENGVIFRANIPWLFKVEQVRAEGAIAQVSSGRYTYLFLAAHPEGLIFTWKRDGNLDVMMMPFEGLLPEFDTPEQQLDFALSLDNPFDRLLAFRQLRRFQQSEQLQQALYLASRIDFEKKWYDKQASNLRKLDREKKPLGDWQGLARVDMAIWDVVATVGLATETGVRLQNAQVEDALAKLKAVHEQYTDNRHVLAYIKLREADMLDLADRDLDAIAAYETVSASYSDQADIAVQARLKLADLFGILNTSDLQVGYYLSVFSDFPEFEEWKRLAAARAIAELRRGIQQDPEIDALLNPPEFDAQRRRIPEKLRDRQRAAGRVLVDQRLVDDLRRQIEKYPSMPLLGAIFQFEIGRIYKRLGQLDLAIRAMERVVSAYPDQKADLTRAVFALGEYSIQLSRELRAAGRFNEAGKTYADALGYYERITTMYPPEHEHHIRARKEFLSLGLLKAGQAEREGDIEQAIADYTRLVAFDSSVVQAHRKLIFYGVQKGDFGKLKSHYQAMVDENPGSFIGHYGLGYLYTWHSNLSLGDLDDAEEELRKAMGLNSQSPYVYLTLGWVYEMRELYFGEFTEGWLEEAIKMYDQAWRVNDRGLDLQVEADILLNLGNGFVQLGNTWTYAYDMYHQRLDLNLPFLDPKQEALFSTNLGRAAFNLNHYSEASGHFDRALQLARKTKLTRLQAEVIARQALNLQMQGDYDQSTQFFERSIQTYKEVGQLNAIAALMRSIALNYFYLGQREQATIKLRESLRLLDQYGTRDPGEFTRLALAPGMSLAPRGFDTQRERSVNASLRQLILSDLQQFEQSARYLDYKAAYLDRLLADSGGEDAEIMREQMVVQNRQARLALALGDDALAIRQFGLSYLTAEAIQSVELEPDDPELAEADEETLDALLHEDRDSEKKFVFSAQEFVGQIVNACSQAEILLREDAHGQSVQTDSLDLIRKRLTRLSKRLDIAQADASEPVVRPDYIWRLYSDLALISLAQARLLAPPEMAESEEASGSWNRFMAEAHLYSDAVTYLRRIIAQTQALLDLSQSETPPEPIEELSSLTVLRMHVQSLLNLSEVASYFETPEQQREATSRGFQYIEKALAVCDQWRLDDVCLLARMSKAERVQDMAAAESILADFQLLPPEILGGNYIHNAEAIRWRLYSSAAKLVLSTGNASRAWLILEQETRRLFIDELSRLSTNVDSPETREILATLAGFVKQYRTLSDEQNLTDSAEVRTARNTKLTELAATVQKGYDRLAQVAPRFHALLTVTPFTLESAQAALDENEAAVSFAALDNVVHAFVLTKTESRHVAMKTPLSETRALITRYREQLTDAGSVTSAAAAIVGAKLLKPVKRLLGSATLLYIDGDRIATDLPWQALAESTLKPAPAVLRIASLRGLADSFSNRNLYTDSGWATLSSPSPEQAVYDDVLRKFAGTQPGWTFSETPNLLLKNSSAALAESGIRILDQPLRFEGESAANMWLRFDEVDEGFGHFAFAEHLDALWRSNIILFPQVEHTQLLRAERICLERLLHSFGVAGYVTATRELPRDQATATALTTFAASVTELNHVQARDKALASLAQSPLEMLWRDRIQVWGYKGMDTESARAYAQAMLWPVVDQAIKRQLGGAPRAAVELYEQSLRLMNFLGDTKYLDKVLEMLVSQSAAISDWDRTIRYQLQVLARAKAAQEAAPDDLNKLVTVIKAKEALSNYYVKARRFDEALAANQEIIDTLIATKREALTATYHGQRGIFLEFAGRYKESLDEYLVALALFTQANNISGRIEQSANAARILRMYLARYRMARQYLEEALALSAQADLYQKLRLKLELARVNFAMGSFQLAADISREIIGQSKQAIDEVLVKGKEIAQNATLTADQKKQQLSPLFNQKLQMESALIQAYLELVNALFRMGDYSQALELYETGIALAKSKNDLLKQIQFTNVKGLIYAQIGDTLQAVESFTWMLDQATAANIPGEQANALSNLGDAWRKAGEFGKARDMFTRAMLLDQRQNSQLGLAFDNANLGLTYENMVRNDEAVQYLTKALTISRTIGNPINEAKGLLGLGRIALSENRLDDAATYLSEGLALTERLNMTDWSWRFRLQHGRVLLKRNDAAGALTDFMAGVATVETMPPSVRQRGDGPKIEEARSEVYDEALDILANENRAEEAFALSERYRARHFLDLVGSVRPSYAVKGAAELFAREATLANELRSVSDALSKASDSEKPAIEERRQSIRRDYDDVIAGLAALDAELPAYVTVRTQSTENLVALLPHDTPLLSYFATRRQLIIFGLDSNGLTMKTVSVTRRKLFDDVRMFRKLITNFHPVDEQAQQLYSVLIAPMADWIGPRDRLLIVPFGSLHSLPFAALHDGKDFLVASTRIGYLSSVGQLAFMPVSENTRPAGSATLALGGPFVRPSDDPLGELPFTANELDALAAVMPSAHILRNETATVEAFKRLAPEQSWLHIATHARYDQMAPFASYLALAAADTSNGNLTLADILSVPLKANLVSLSACETAVGELAEGDGQISLSRAFITAGAQRVLASLWRVSDLSTAVLMKHWFREMQAGDPSLALQRAQQTVRKQFPHPAYWAGFRLEGRP